MCNYCDKNAEHELDHNNPNVYVEFDEQLTIIIPWKQGDITMATACSVPIIYCPWCGRKLEEENGFN